MQSLLCETSDILNNGLEKLSASFRAHSHTKKAFKAVAQVIDELLKFVIEEQNKDMVGSLRESNSTNPSQ